MPLWEKNGWQQPLWTRIKLTWKSYWCWSFNKTIIKIIILLRLAGYKNINDCNHFCALSNTSYPASPSRIIIIVNYLPRWRTIKPINVKLCVLVILLSIILFLNSPHSTSVFFRNKTFHKIRSHALLSIPSKGSNIPSFERNMMKCKSFELARGFDLWERLHK